jgi:hypothetical protein
MVYAIYTNDILTYVYDMMANISHNFRILFKSLCPTLYYAVGF